MKKTKAQELGITTFPYQERNDKGYVIYEEYSDGIWCKYKFDDNGIMTNCERSDGQWWNVKLNDKGNETYLEYDYGFKLYTII